MANANQELVEDALASELIGHIGIGGSDQDAQPLDFSTGKVWHSGSRVTVRVLSVSVSEILRRQDIVH